MKKFYKILPFLLITIMLLSVFQITPVSAKPSPKPVINIEADPTEPSPITVGEPMTINISSNYNNSINWAVSTTLGTASINPSITESGNHLTVLTVSSEIAGTGIVRITATDSTKKNIKSTISINLEFVSGSEPPNAAPVFNGSFTITTDEDKSGSVDVTAEDPDGDNLTYTYTQPSNGSVSNTEITYNYEPNLNFNGTDTFTVTASDGKDSTTVTVEITVEPVNDAPVAADDTAAGKVGDTVRVYVLANDSDIDNDSLSIDSYTSVDGATISEGNNYFDITAENAGVYTFSYWAYDGILTSNEADVTVTFTDDLVYLALGDSIPYGYYNTSLWNYLSGGTDSYSYIEQFRDAVGILPANYYDESASGNNSIDVLNQLSNSVVQSLIVEADVITLCVGGNDIMDAVPRTFSGLDKYNVDWAVADEGRDNFETNWCKIIDGIEELNPDVTLIVMTIYNPYRLSDSYYAEANPYFEDSTVNNYGLNYIIRHTETMYNEMLSDGFDYRVVDIYEAFNNAANKDSLTGFYNSFCDPHPNQAGHNLIFTEHYNIYN